LESSDTDTLLMPPWAGADPAINPSSRTPRTTEIKQPRSVNPAVARDLVHDRRW
jgi:hypothetical protein